jgi:hypothetical protein
MIGGIVALLHPSIDVAARLDLPLMHMRRMAKRGELFADPKSPVLVARCIADENIGHDHRSPASGGS